MSMQKKSWEKGKRVLSLVLSLLIVWNMCMGNIGPSLVTTIADETTATPTPAASEEAATPTPAASEEATSANWEIDLPEGGFYPGNSYTLTAKYTDPNNTESSYTYEWAFSYTGTTSYGAPQVTLAENDSSTVTVVFPALSLNEKLTAAVDFTITVSAKVGEGEASKREITGSVQPYADLNETKLSFSPAASETPADSVQTEQDNNIVYVVMSADSCDAIVGYSDATKGYDQYVMTTGTNVAGTAITWMSTKKAMLLNAEDTYYLQLQNSTTMETTEWVEVHTIKAPELTKVEATQGATTYADKNQKTWYAEPKSFDLTIRTNGVDLEMNENGLPYIYYTTSNEVGSEDLSLAATSYANGAATVSLSKESVNADTVYFYVKDKLGNASALKACDLSDIDTTSPEIALTVKESATASETPTSTEIPMESETATYYTKEKGAVYSVTFSDAETKIKSAKVIYPSTSEAPLAVSEQPTEVTDTFRVTYATEEPAEGTYSYTLAATNNVEMSTTATLNVVYDATAPTISASPEPYYNANDKAGTTAPTLDVTVADGLSGVETVTYTAKRGSKSLGSGTASVENGIAVIPLAYYSADGTDEYEVTVTDKAGNSATETYKITWDTTAPAVSANPASYYNAEDAEASDAEASDAPALEVSVADDGSGIVQNTEGTSYIEYSVKYADGTTLAATAVPVENGVASIPLNYKADGTDTYTIITKDVAGNTADKTEYKINWDTTAPTCDSITVSDDTNSSVWNKVWAFFTSKQKVSISVEAKDVKGSGVQTVTGTYTVKSDDDTKKTKDFTCTFSSGVDENGETVYVFAYPVEESEDAEIEFNSITITDAAGNTTTIKNPETSTEVPHGSIVIDQTAPKLTVTLPSAAPEATQDANGVIYYNGDVNVSVKFKLEEKFFLRAGKTTYKPNATTTPTGSETPETVYDNHYGDAEESFVITKSTDGGETYATIEPAGYKEWVHVGSTYTKEVSTASPSPFEDEGRYHLEYEMTDAVGHEMEGTEGTTVTDGKYTVDFVVDKTAPVVDIKYYDEKDNEISISKGGYYNQAVKAVIEVTEKNFDKDGTTITSAKGEDYEKEPAVSEWTQNGDVWTATVTFSEDDEYPSFKFSCTDLAGNTSNEIETASFTIDKTAPTIDIQYQKLNEDGTMTTIAELEDGAYYDRPIFATVTIKEHNFDSNEVMFECTPEPQTEGDWSQGEDDTWKKTVQFFLDEEYKLTVNYSDKAGNSSDKTRSFTIDTVDPKVTVSYSDAVRTDDNGRKYYKDATEMTIVVEEHNFDAAKITSNWSVQNAAGGNITDADTEIEKIKEALTTPGNWTPDATNPDKYTFTYTFDTKAAYTMDLSVKDLADREGVRNDQEKDLFTIDATAPEISYEVSFWNYENTRYTNYQYFASEFIRITATVKNDYAPGYVFTLTKQESGGTLGEDMEPIETPKVSYNTETGKELTVYTYDLSADFRGTLSGIAEDYAGNTAAKSVLDSAKGFIVESEDKHNESDSIEITLSPEPNKNGFYNSDVDVTVTMSDTYSGIRKLTWNVLKDNGTVWDSAVTKDYGTDTSISDIYTEEYSEKKTITASDFESNDVKIVASFTDNAENTSKASKEIKIDQTAPVVDIAYDLNQSTEEITAAGGAYYSETRTATITVTEHNFDPANELCSVNFNWTRAHDEETAPKISEWTQDGDVWTATVTFADEDDYTFTFSCADLAGNASVFSDATTEAGTDAQSFTVDKTVPVVDIAYDLNQSAEEITAAGGAYYSETRTATITVTEHNFDPANELCSVNFNWTRAHDKETAPKISEWTQNGDVWTATVTFSEDDDYTFTFSCKDLAGNASVFSDTTTKAGTDAQSFTVDKTVPVVDIAYDLNQSAEEITAAGGAYYSETRIATVTVTEHNFNPDSETCAVKFDWTRAHDEETEPEISEWTQDGDVWTATVTFSEDDDYTFTFSCADLAGNASVFSDATTEAGTDAQSFTIDQTAPVVDIAYDLNQSAEEITAAGGAYYSETRTATITVTEHNFDPANELCSVNFNWTRAHDEETAPMISEWTQNGDVWTATVTFSEDDDYTFTFSCADLAGNASVFSDTTTKAGTDAQSFTIDQTAPQLGVAYSSSVSDRATAKCEKFYNEANPATITITVVEHNFDPSVVADKLNLTAVTDTVTATYVNTEVSANVGEVAGLQAYLRIRENWTQSGDTWTITYPFESNAVYTLENITVEDLAGNSAGHENNGVSDVFTVDKTAPGITYDVTRGKFEQSKYTDYQYFANDYIEITATVTNDYAPEYAFTLTKKDIDQSEGEVLEPISSSVTSNKSGERVTVYTYKLEPNFKGTISGTEEDYAGNTTTKSVLDNANGLIVENETKHNASEDITITTDREPNANGFYNSDVKVTVTMRDTYSGIKNLEWDALKGSAQVDGSVEYKSVWDSSVTKNYDDNGSIFAETYSETRTLSASDFNSNHVKISAAFTDNAGNPSSNELTEIKIDNVAPVVSITYDLNDPSNGSYYNETRTATVQVTERNFDETRVNFDYTSEHGNTPSISGWTCISGSPGESDDTVWQATVIFAADDDYTFTFNCTDLADNKSAAVETESFTIDKTKPQLSIAYSSPVSGRATAQCERFYNEANPATVTITVKEHNFDPSVVADELGLTAVADTVTATYVNTEVSADVNEVTGLQAYLRSKGNWKQNGDTWTITYTFSSNAVYTLQDTTVKDLAGNSDNHKNSGISDVFTVDKTEPNGIAYEITKQTFVQNYLSYQYFDPDYLQVTATVTNDYAPGYDFLFTATDINSAVYTGATETNRVLAAGGNEITTYTFNLPADFKGKISGHAEDYAANDLIIDCTNGLVAETETMHQATGSITITPDREPNANGFYNSDVNVTVAMSDTYSGIQQMEWDGRVGGEIVMPVIYDYTGESDVIYSYNETRTLDATTFNSNSVSVTAGYTDNTGRTMESTLEGLMIDNVAPVVSITYDLNDPSNERYYNKTRTATVQVTERNFDETRVNFTYTSEHGNAPSISGWTCISGSPGESDDTVWQATVTFAEDDDYTFTFSCTDLADNESAAVETQSFTIDQTAPVISVSYTNKDVANGKYYKADQTGVVTVTEHNFTEGSVKAEITASLEGKSITAPQLGSFSGSGDVHTARVNYTEDGDYTFTISYTDAAGNVSTAYVTDSFTVDKTAPVITISNVESKTAYPNTITPEITFTDVNYNSQGIDWQLTRMADLMEGDTQNTEVNEYVYTRSDESTGHGEVISYSDFDYTREVDGIYELTASITDLAGNTATVETGTMIFSVNRFGSTYMLEDSATLELLEKGYIKEEQEVVYTEVNPNKVYHMTTNADGEETRVEGSEVLVTYNNGSTPQTYALESDAYKVEKNADSDTTWNAYTYTVYKENFEEEGRYEVTFDSIDEGLADKSRNASDMVIEELLPAQTSDETKTELEETKAKISFTVDKTAPSVVISGIEDKGSYNAEDREFTIDASDSIALDSVEVIVDDESVQTSAEIYEQTDTSKYTLAESSQPYEVKVVVTDRAGNSAEKSVTRVLVSSNFFVRFYNNKVAFFGTIAAVVVVAGGIFFLILFKRRKKDDEEEQAQA